MNIETEVDRLFAEAPDRFDPTRENPVTGGRWVVGLDRIGPQKRAAVRALKARVWFAESGPPDAPRLPLSGEERGLLEAEGQLARLVAWYARSLLAANYDYDRHPSFEDYARGIMASPHTWECVRNDPELLKRFPPKPLPGLNRSRVWEPRK